MTKPRLATSLLVVALGLTACGGGDGDSGPDIEGAPTTASSADFCAAWDGLGSNEGKPSERAATLVGVGTPANIPADARAGFEVLLTLAVKAGDDSTSAEIAQLGADLSDDDENMVSALFTYAATECK